MGTWRLSSRIPIELIDKIDLSRDEMKESRGITPTRTAWILEAIAEKLNQEKDGK